MKKGEVATAISALRIIVLCVMLCGAAAGSSFFIFQPSSINAQTQQGKASFYSKRATGSRTANGERLHHDSMTCAHRTLPFGTLLKVTHLGNERSVIVRVNDRGPFVRDRIIDLSWGAARELGMLGQGIATVFVEPADEITIPLKAGKERIEIPRYSFISEIDTLGAIWQHELEIDHQKVQQRMKRTAQKSLFKRLREQIGF